MARTQAVTCDMEPALEALRTLTRVLPRLESVTGSVPDLVALAPELICELGFDRGLISRITDNIWYLELMYVMGDPEWADAILQAGRAHPPGPGPRPPRA